VGAVVAVGLLIGGNLDHIVALVTRAGYIGLGIAVALVILFVVLHHMRKRRELREGERLLRSAEKGAGD
jgi:uncharacterized membrane protein YccC